MLEKIQLFAEKYNMFPKGATVICGLSGGADSVCLVTCLTELSKKFDITVEALHVNHCLRGAESDRDEQFCREFCQRLGINLTCVSFDVQSYAAKYSLSIEEAARKARYAIFKEHSSGKLIATAHNANDNLETIILNLIRGTALKGMTGIPPVRDNIVRPMLTVTRTEIETLLKQRNLQFVTDSTNLSDDYTRNKIRHNIIPLMTEINSSLIETAVGSVNSLRSENNYIEEDTDIAYRNCCRENSLCGLSDYHEVIRRRCIARLLTKHNVPYSYGRLSAADYIAVSGGKINVSGDLYLISDGSKISLEEIPPQQMEIKLKTNLKIGDNQIFDSKILSCELICDKTLTSEQIVNTKLAIYYIDYDKIKGEAFVRNRRFGDKIKLSGRNFTSSVKKMINEKVPREKRAYLHFIDDELGTIFAEELGIADRVAPDYDTKRLLKITVIDVL